MAVYSLDFAEKLLAAATLVTKDDIKSVDAQRTVLYLSLLSTEISLKAMLERAGISLKSIRGRSHDLASLMRDLGKCRIKVVNVGRVSRLLSAMRLRAKAVKYLDAETTVGKILDAERKGASKYPNEIRYGDLLRHFPAQVVTKMAKIVLLFARTHWDSICT